MEPIQEIIQKISTSRNLELGFDMTAEELEQSKVDSFNSAIGSLDDGYDCEVCKNKGLIMRAEQNANGSWYTVTTDCKCMRVRSTIRRMKKSGLKNIIKDYTFDKYDDTEDWQKTIKQSAMDYAKNPKGWFFVGGQTGSGKSMICTAICRELLLQGRSVLYMIWREDIVRLKSVVTDSEQYSNLMDKYKNVEVLYIDDLFKTGKGPDGSAQRPTSADVNVAFEILNYRYNNPNLLTIISSECTINELLDIDEATGGRICERAKVFSIKPNQRKNYRLKGVIEL